MPDPTAAGAALGLKYASLVAGFAGGVVSLSYMRSMSRMQMSAAVVAGTCVAGYLTPLAALYWNIPVETENAVAFLLGLTSMNIVPGIVRLSSAFRRNPGAFVPTGGGDQ